MPTLDSNEELRQSIISIVDEKLVRAMRVLEDDTPIEEQIADAVMELYLTDKQAAIREARKDQTWKVIRGLVKAGSISDRSAAHSLAMHTTILNQPTKEETNESAEK